MPDSWTPLTIFWASYLASVIGSLGAMFMAGSVTPIKIGQAFFFWGVLGCGAGTFASRWLVGTNRAIETITVAGCSGALLGSGVVKLDEALNAIRRFIGAPSNDRDDQSDRSQRNPPDADG